MKIIKVKDYNQLSQLAGERIIKRIEENPDLVLGLATGATPEGIYQYLVEKYQEKAVDFSRCSSVNLDEYKGLPRESEQSYYYYMFSHLFSKINLPEERIHLPNGTAQDGEEECRRYEQLIEQMGGVDLQLLGIGQNGHIGFNEPDDYFTGSTHCVTLTQSTLQANSKYFRTPEEMPKQAYTMGIGTIMKAREILLVASGENKAKALHDTICGRVTPQMPASILQFHPNVTILGDEEALHFWKEGE